MFSKIKTYFYIVLYSIPLFICFSFASVEGFCLAQEITLDSTALEVLNGGAYQGIGASNYYGLNAQGYDPLSLFVLGAGGDMLDRTNAYLQNNYDFDLSDMAFGINDMIETASWNSGTADGIISNLTKGTYTTLPSLMENGFKLLSSKVMAGGMAAKILFTGVVDDVTGKITSINNNNAYVKLTDTYIDNLNEVSEEFEQDTDIPNLSDSKHILGKKFQINSSYDFNIYNFEMDRNFVLYYLGSAGTYQYKVGIVYPTSYNLSNYFSNGFGIGTSGTRYSFDDIRCTNANTISINGITYTYGQLELHYQFGWASVTSVQPIAGYLGVPNDFIRDYDPYGDMNDYRYGYSNSQNISDLLSLLRNKWVTTDDLAQINEKLDNLTLGNIVIDGSNYPVIDTDTGSDGLDDLADLIQDILDRNAVVNSDTNFDAENSVTTQPEPEPEPNPELDFGGTSLPDDFVPFGWTQLFDTLKLPFEFSGLFQPLFYVFGSFAGLWAIWTFVPIAILALLFIWALK